MMQAKIVSWSALKYQLRAWQVFGIAKPPEDPIKRRIYIFHAFFVNIIALLALQTTFVGKVYKAKNIGEFLEYLYPTITCSSVVLKILNCFMFRDYLMDIHSIFVELDARARTSNEISVLEKAIKAVHSFFLLFFKIVAAITISSILIIIFSNEPTLLFPAWYPWDYTKSRLIYTLTIMHQLYAVVFVGLQETANAAYPQAYLHMLTAHVKALKLRVLDLGKLKQDSEQPTTAYKQERQIYKELSSCIKDHMSILHLHDKIQAVLSMHCLIQLGATGLVQCAIAVSLLYADLSEFSKIMQMFTFFGAITIEMFILCYSGEMFCDECEKLCHAIYDSNWVGQSLSFQKAIIIFIHRSQQFNVIMAGKFLPINYPTFLRLVKGSYSMFTLLNNFRER